MSKAVSVQGKISKGLLQLRQHNLPRKEEANQLVWYLIELEYEHTVNETEKTSMPKAEAPKDKLFQRILVNYRKRINNSAAPQFPGVKKIKMHYSKKEKKKKREEIEIK